MSDEDPQYGPAAKQDREMNSFRESSTAAERATLARAAERGTHADREQAKLRQQTRAPRDRQLTHVRRDR